MLGCGVAKWLSAPDCCSAAPGSNSLASAQEIKEQESHGADFSQSSSRSLLALQQACRPATRDEYFINAVDRKLQNKQKSAKKVVIVVIKYRQIG
jgi:hypothetical protein